jgi:ankyrin repeat protein
LSIACFKGHYDIVNYLAEIKEVSIDLKKEKNSTALIYACLGGHLDIIMLLVEKGADIEIKGKACIYIYMYRYVY